jgi:hypothetical protein
MGTRPLSVRAKALIDLQTFEGSFDLAPALAAQLGIPLANLESSLERFVPSDAGLNMDTRRRLWATVLAVRLFEGKLPGEKSVWELVVQKARAWLRAWTNVNEADMYALEELAAELLGT